MRQIPKTEQSSIQKIIDLLPVAIFIYQGENNTLVNPAAEALTGYTKEELLDMKFWEVVHPDFRQLIRDRGLARQHGEKVPPRYEVKILTKSGAERWLDFIGGLIRLDGKPAVIGTVIDVTERKQAQERRQLELQRLNALRDINLAITSTLDLRSVLEMLLGEIGRLLPDTAITVRLKNRDSGEFEYVACHNINEAEWRSGTGQRGGQLSERVLKTRAPLAIRNIHIDPRGRGSKFFRERGFISYLGVPLTVKGESLGIVSFFTKEERDFTDTEIDFLTTLAGQAAMAIHNSQLHEQTKKQSIALEKANELKDEFLGFVSHELRTPLNALVGYTGMIQDEMFGAINSEQKRILAKVIDHARNVLNMVTGLLEAARIEAGPAKIEPRDVSLNLVLDELKSTNDTPLDKELTLDWNYSEALPVIKTDREKLRHILQNLVDNAIKFTETGKITISARSLPGSDAVEFKVSDTGIGIPRESVPGIFERFRQGPNSQALPSAGVGLGLHIVKKFTEMLGGDVTVQSEPGKGSTFTVTIPC
ncbi:MAG: PAS domain S-box protein [Deltaproteobacteria bacterium]|nr:PAS domain S-box protein [Deltaproteobacteria bacterium]